MPKRKIDIKRVFIPSDAVAILVIIIGMVIAIFLDEVAIRLIGVSISVLGAVALFMMISQRISELVNMRHTPTESGRDFKMIRKKGDQATSTIVEDYDQSFGIDDKDIDSGNNISDESIANADSDVTSQNVDSTSPFKSQEKGKLNENHLNNQKISKGWSDENSGFSIVGKIKKGDEQVSPSPSEKTNDDKASESKPLPTTPVEPKTIDINKTEAKPDTPKQAEPKQFPPSSVKQETVQSAAKITFPQKTEPKVATPEIKSEEKTIVDNLPVEEKIIKPLEDIKPKDTSHKAEVLDDYLDFLIEDIPIMGQEPRKEFDYFLNRIMILIRNFTNAKTAAFLMLNNEKKQLILEAHVSNDGLPIISNKKLDFGNDKISQIIRNGKPEILTEINPSAELDLIPYYTRKTGTVSFIGVPVFFRGKVAGVLCADANIIDAYDKLTVTFMGHLTKVISGLLHNYSEKYDMLQASRTLSAISRFRSIMANLSMSIDDIEKSLFDTMKGIFDFPEIGLCNYNNKTKVWSIVDHNSKNNNLKGEKVDLKNSLVGQSIIRNKTILNAKSSDKVIRINDKEEKRSSGYFISCPIPMKAVDSVHGALFVSGNNPGNLTKYDIQLMETICEHAGSSIEKMKFIDLLQTSAIIDTNNFIHNSPAFYFRLKEEVERAKDMKSQFSLCLISIDKYESFDAGKHADRMERAIFHIIGIVKKMMKKYDVFGRSENSGFGVILIDKDAESSKVWAEKLRNEIAINGIKIDNKKYNITVSIGISSSQNSENVEELIDHAKKGLSVSVSATNKVTVYS